MTIFPRKENFMQSYKRQVIHLTRDDGFLSLSFLICQIVFYDENFHLHLPRKARGIHSFEQNDIQVQRNKWQEVQAKQRVR